MCVCFSGVFDADMGYFDDGIQPAGGSCIKFVNLLASACPAWADTRDAGGPTLKFMKRAQLCAAVLNRAGLVAFDDIAAMTVFSDYR